MTRLGGATRYDTAVKAAELIADRYSDAAGEPCFTTQRIGLARARVPFDSFSAGPLLGRLCAPLLLADPAAVPPDTAAFLDASRAAGATAGATALELSVFGGDAAVSQAALDAYLSGEGAGAAETEAGDSDTPGVLPAGTCGGSIEDEPRPLLDSDRAEDPSWSPDGTRIAFGRGDLAQSSLIVADLDGVDEVVVVDLPGRNWMPRWSPDGQRIAFSRAVPHDDESGQTAFTSTPVRPAPVPV
ncbi:cell wall-binding repeat-containing protein [Candidatus Poriferisodalis sp.]|uniref:cell wall-binding repeat-containing protein n=1 Tax=Candidatus Poriferisodalis sp. TaxID=3101277 RepID=UPI003B52718F